jgi:hypothetical protein
MRHFSPSKPSPIILPGEHELEELEKENKRLRKLAVTLQEKMDALRNGKNLTHRSANSRLESCGKQSYGY